MTERIARGLLDTSVLIDLDVLDPDVLPGRSRVSSVTMAELAFGLHTTTDPSERAVRVERLQQAEALLNPLPFTAATARRFGQAVGLVIAAGRDPRPRRQDMMIAATASVHRLPLFTRNPADFKGLESILTVVPV